MNQAVLRNRKTGEWAVQAPHLGSDESGHSAHARRNENIVPVRVGAAKHIFGPLPVWFIDAHDSTGAHRGNPDLAGMRRKQSVSRVFVSIGTPHRDVNLSIDQVGRCARQSGGQHRHHRFMDVLLGIYQCPVNSPAR